MKAAARKDMIDVDALSVGMFVHLDLGWMSHPFPLGNFKISEAGQIATIRSLGLRQVRWSPAQSDVIAPTPASGGADSGAAVAVAAAASASASTPAPARETSTSATAATATEAAAESVAIPTPAPTATLEPPAAQAHRQHREQLAREAESLALCERQFAEAALACQRLSDCALTRPKQAREQAEGLSKALVDKMLIAGDLCIRLLSDAAGDKASVHALNVTVISLLMGRTFNLTEADMLDLGVGAMLHDIGKLELPERARHHDEQLNSAELRQYEDHVARGVVLARKMGLSGGATLVLAQHHEHADGSGFPLRLGTDRMTAAARIVSLVNRYDNLCNPHRPSQAKTPHEALALLFAQGKTKFDSAILGALIRMMGVYPAGSTVQLTDDRYALVVGVNSSRPLRPRVLVHEAGVPRSEALIVDLERLLGVGIRRTIKPLQLPAATLDYLAPRARVSYFFEPLRAAAAVDLACEAEAAH